MKRSANPFITVYKMQQQKVKVYQSARGKCAVDLIKNQSFYEKDTNIG